ncbi:scavenger receptor cysteine-rich type 1 protein M130-like isoform X2 [Anabas testudineus]|uniref:scavenger receptor cysteine-rich type 1 protein M130-like isoform X2 n=1 Tax=Anabas testudineus TaxID=64144 RepID=UPI000E456D51|nr:scavenger receptor cysteine-rich type 1 protein M130-like isoform X2 [Anabas testudineus]
MWSRQEQKLHFLTVGVQTRLSGSGSTQCSGRVEIFYNNTWGTVCDDGWDLNDAEVVCRELGCGAVLNATQSALFGEGTGQIWLDDVDCSGSESSLSECQHRGFGNNKCSHSKDAGVICSVPLLILVSSVAVGSLLLLLLVLLVVCLVCRRMRRRRSKQLQGHNLNQYEDRDYVNVSLAKTKKKVKDEVDRVKEEESDDYEKPDSDDSNDYDDVVPANNYMIAEKIRFNLKNYRDNKEEDDGSDDEHDYVNELWRK